LSHKTNFKKRKAIYDYLAYQIPTEDDLYHIFVKPYLKELDVRTVFFKTVYNMTSSLPRPRILKILEVGCGIGYVMHVVNRWKHISSEMIGLDISEIINIAQKRFSTFSFVQGDAFSLPFRKNSFHGLLLSETLEHLPFPALSFFAEANRVLKLGGFLVISTPNWDRFTRIPTRLISWVLRKNRNVLPDTPVIRTPRSHRQDIYNYTFKELYYILNTFGFQVKYSYGAFYLMKPYWFVKVLNTALPKVLKPAIVIGATKIRSEIKKFPIHRSVVSDKHFHPS
jgi:ubiquinone/menaquinone biosynthesis C-methylase UbiE